MPSKNNTDLLPFDIDLARKGDKVVVAFFGSDMQHEVISSQWEYDSSGYIAVMYIDKVTGNKNWDLVTENNLSMVTVKEYIYYGLILYSDMTYGTIVGDSAEEINNRCNNNGWELLELNMFDSKRVKES